MNRRIAFAWQWFVRENNVTFLDLISKLLTPTCTMKARSLISRNTAGGDFLEIRIGNRDDTLFFPRQLPLRSLYQCVAETFDSSDWHYYEIDETKVESDDVVLDCGAAEGLFTLSVSDRCRRVYAIEPLPYFVGSLMKTFSDRSNVEVIPVALADKPGRALLEPSDISSSISSEGSIEVEVQTIDDLFYNKGISIDYIKADLEGSEVDMLMGAEQTIRAFKPKIAITTYHAASHALEISSLLRKWVPGYNVKTKGIEERAGAPVMLHAWYPSSSALDHHGSPG